MVRIVESYRNYTPPRWVRPAVERLLSTLAPEHVGNLDAVVLTNSAQVGKGKTQRVGGRKYLQRDCRGFYHPAQPHARAWIEMIVDNIIPPWRSVLPLNPIRDAAVGFTLYHEVGHHLHETVGSAKRGGEASADDWALRLSERHFRRRYRIWMTILVAIGPLLAPFAMRFAKRRISPVAPAGSRST